MKYKQVKRFVIFTLLLSMINLASAGGWYNNFEISQLQYSRGADGVHVVFSGGSGNPNPDNCQNADRFIAPFSSDIPEREQAMLSGVIAAYAAEKQVKVLLDGCMLGIGGTTYPVVWYFYSM